MNNRRKIFFRADASAEIGYGHFIRTLALADMLKDDFDCVFYTQEPSEYQKSEMEAVCSFMELPADDSRFDIFLNQLEGDEIVVLDNYFYTTDYQRRIKEKGCKLVCIDDMHDKHYVSDVIINHGIVKDNEFDCEPYTRLFLGRDYELLRKPFLQPIRGLKRNNNVVISFGGADPFHLTERFVSLLLMIKIPYHIITLIGDKTYLSEENREKVEIRKNLTAQQVADLFETSAFGIFPASSVSLEAMSRELPIMIGYYVDNQKEGYERFMSRGSFIPLDYLPDLSKEKLVHAIKSLDTFEPSKRDSSAIIDNFKQMFRSL